MDIASICLLGGTGFVGRSIADQAYARGMRVRVLTRSEPKANEIKVVPTVEVMQGSPYDEATLALAFEGIDAVVNLVGVLHPPRGRSFGDVHTELPGTIARACRASGVQHLVHMSALGAAEKAPSEYLRSKAAGEAAVRMNAGAVAWTVFRPSVIFGEQDRFLNLFASLAGLFPVIPLAAADAKFQPVWVEDVARCFVAALGNAHAFGQAYELCGPKVYTLAELVQLAARLRGQRRRIVALPEALGRAQAFVFEHLPGHIMTRDNLRSMSVPNVCSGRFPDFCGFEPSAVEAIAPSYLAAGWHGRTRYARYRNHAGR